jgi:hypothetical protein
VEQRAADDPNLHYLDGMAFYGERDFTEPPLPDQLHPGRPMHRRIGERFASFVFFPRWPFSRRALKAMRIWWTS